MDSPHSPGYFEDEDLRALQSALEDIWSDLKAHDPDRNWDADNELKTRIAEKLMALASTGINRPEELRRLALETLPLHWGKDKKVQTATTTCDSYLNVPDSRSGFRPSAP